MVIMHDVFSEEGTVVLVEVQLIKYSLFAGWSVFFFEHQSKFTNIRSHLKQHIIYQPKYPQRRDIKDKYIITIVVSI